MRKYNLINQEPFLCVPCCLEMIFDRRGIKLDKTQLDIGLMLGFKLDPVENKESYDYYLSKGIEIPIGDWKKGQSGCGLGPFVENVSKPLNLGLNEIYFTKSALMFDEEEEFLNHCKAYLDNENGDVLLAIDYNVIKLDGNYTYNDDVYGHMLLLESINEDNSFNVVIPEKESKGGTFRKTIPFDVIYKSFARPTSITMYVSLIF